MTISYNLITSDRKRHPIIYACFGLLNTVSRLCYSSLDTNSRFFKGDTYHGNVSYEPRDILAVEYNYQADINRHLYNEAKIARITSTFMEELDEFLNAFPWVKPITKVNKRLGVVRVKAKRVPADKMMFVLTSVRNLMMVNKDFHVNSSDSYIELQEYKKKAMPDYRAYWIYENLMADSRSIDWTCPNQTAKWIAFPVFNHESNTLNAATFGKESLKRLMSGEEPEWFQEFFNRTEDGYERDQQYEDEYETFGTKVRIWYKDLDCYNKYGEMWSCRHLYRTMADSLSVEWDYECIFQGGRYDLNVGFIYNGFANTTVEEAINQFLKAIEE